MPEPYASFVRKTPKQQRSRQRLDLILDTTASLLAQVGANDLTMARLAEASGLTPSSVYEYVNDVPDAIAAVGMRGLFHLRNELETMFAMPGTPEEASDVVRSLFRVVIDFFHNEVGFREAVATMDANPALALLNVDDSRTNAKRAVELLGPLLSPDLASEDLYSRALIAVHLSGEIADLLLRLPEDEATKVASAYERILLDMFGLP